MATQFDRLVVKKDTKKRFLAFIQKYSERNAKLKGLRITEDYLINRFLDAHEKDFEW